jgi:hypothetical protein
MTHRLVSRLCPAGTNPGTRKLFPKASIKSVECDLLHKRSGPACPKIFQMTQESPQPSLDPHRDIGTDYILIATGVGAALIALIYLLI